VEELANRAEGRPGASNPDTEANKGIKYIILDMPRPQRGGFTRDVSPGQLPTMRSNVDKS